MSAQGFSKTRSTYEYTGSSMCPTLLPGDGLMVVPYEKCEAIRTGDVVVFSDHERDRTVVHRVVAIGKGGIRTQGDHNSHQDQGLLRPGDIFGKVVKVRRRNRTIALQNGLIGFFVGWGCQMRQRFVMTLGRWGAKVYRRLVNSKIFSCPVECLRLQIVYFQQKNIMMLRMFGRWTVGTYRPERQCWQIQRPFRLFLDERRLPIPPQVQTSEQTIHA